MVHIHLDLNFPLRLSYYSCVNLCIADHRTVFYRVSKPLNAFCSEKRKNAWVSIMLNAVGSAKTQSSEWQGADTDGSLDSPTTSTSSGMSI
jgi:hypothetical protein